ncbi:MAG: Na(+)-translocating NADH-quinone reductase subunit E [Planctomycetes bacterium ADurb.Bin126]|nr:MAG: Na(+)-translocating NADH-quinone reductase subunit E [Planctomycetes bacterium ADurb.Bin126]
MILMLADTLAKEAAGQNLLAIFFAAAITDNILLTRFLGMCSFLSISSQMRASIGLGLAVIFVTACTGAINAALYWFVLIPLERYGVPASSLQLILFIVVIAAFVQLLEMVIERVSLGLYFALGVFLPLITVNCAILGANLFLINKNLTVFEGFVYSAGAGAGWAVAIILMAGIRIRLKTARIPAALEGPGITLIICGIMALAFIGLSGLIK